MVKKKPKGILKVDQVKEKKGISCDALKCIAMLTMALNHIAHICVIPGTWLSVTMIGVGYFTGPLMCWLIVDGYHHTRSLKKYALRLFIFALISQIPYSLALSSKIISFTEYNMMFTLLCCLGITAAWYEIQNERLKGLIIVGLIAVTYFCDWSIIGPLLTIYYLHFGKDKEGLKKACFLGAASVAIMMTIINIDGESLILFDSAILGGILTGIIAGAATASAGLSYIYLYNGKKAKRGGTFFKWFFYIFYPGHLLILGIIRLIISGII